MQLNQQQNQSTDCLLQRNIHQNLNKENDFCKQYTLYKQSIPHSTQDLQQFEKMNENFNQNERWQTLDQDQNAHINQQIRQMTESSLGPSLTDLNKAIDVQESIYKHNLEQNNFLNQPKFDFYEMNIEKILSDQFNGSVLASSTNCNKRQELIQNTSKTHICQNSLKILDEQSSQQNIGCNQIMINNYSILNGNFEDKIQNSSINNYDNNVYDQFLNWEEQSQINNQSCPSNFNNTPQNIQQYQGVENTSDKELKIIQYEISKLQQQAKQHFQIQDYNEYSSSNLNFQNQMLVPFNQASPYELPESRNEIFQGFQIENQYNRGYSFTQDQIGEPGQGKNFHEKGSLMHSISNEQFVATFRQNQIKDQNDLLLDESQHFNQQMFSKFKNMNQNNIQLNAIESEIRSASTNKQETQQLDDLRQKVIRQFMQTEDSQKNDTSVNHELQSSRSKKQILRRLQELEYEKQILEKQLAFQKQIDDNQKSHRERSTVNLKNFKSPSTDQQLKSIKSKGLKSQSKIKRDKSNGKISKNKQQITHSVLRDISSISINQKQFNKIKNLQKVQLNSKTQIHKKLNQNVQPKDPNYEQKADELNQIFNNYKNEMKKTRQKIQYFQQSSKSINRSRSSKHMQSRHRFKPKDGTDTQTDTFAISAHQMTGKFSNFMTTQRGSNIQPSQSLVNIQNQIKSSSYRSPKHDFQVKKKKIQIKINSILSHTMQQKNIDSHENDLCQCKQCLKNGLSNQYTITLNQESDNLQIEKKIKNSKSCQQLIKSDLQNVLNSRKRSHNIVSSKNIHKNNIQLNRKSTSTFQLNKYYNDKRFSSGSYKVQSRKSVCSKRFSNIRDSERRKSFNKQSSQKSSRNNQKQSNRYSQKDKQVNSKGNEYIVDIGDELFNAKRMSVKQNQSCADLPKQVLVLNSSREKNQNISKLKKQISRNDSGSNKRLSSFKKSQKKILSDQQKPGRRSRQERKSKHRTSDFNNSYLDCNTSQNINYQLDNSQNVTFSNQNKHEVKENQNPRAQRERTSQKNSRNILQQQPSSNQCKVSIIDSESTQNNYQTYFMKRFAPLKKTMTADQQRRSVLRLVQPRISKSTSNLINVGEGLLTVQQALLQDFETGKFEEYKSARGHDYDISKIKKTEKICKQIYNGSKKQIEQRSRNHMCINDNVSRNTSTTNLCLNPPFLGSGFVNSDINFQQKQKNKSQSKKKSFGIQNAHIKQQSSNNLKDNVNQKLDGRSQSFQNINRRTGLQNQRLSQHSTQFFKARPYQIKYKQPFMTLKSTKKLTIPKELYLKTEGRSSVKKDKQIFHNSFFNKQNQDHFVSFRDIYRQNQINLEQNNLNLDLNLKKIKKSKKILKQLDIDGQIQKFDKMITQMDIENINHQISNKNHSSEEDQYFNIQNSIEQNGQQTPCLNIGQGIIYSNNTQQSSLCGYSEQKVNKEINKNYEEEEQQLAQRSQFFDLSSSQENEHMVSNLEKSRHSDLQLKAEQIIHQIQRLTQMNNYDQIEKLTELLNINIGDSASSQNNRQSSSKKEREDSLQKQSKIAQHQNSLSNCTDQTVIKNVEIFD